MTCIVGIAKDGEVYIGGDSFGGNSYIKNMYERPKVFKRENFIIGYTSSFRMGQLLEFSWEPPKPKENPVIRNDYKFIVTKVIPSIQKLFEDNKFGKVENGEQEGGTFLIGYKGKIYSIEDDFSVLEPTDGYHSVGSGRDFALASLASTEDWDDTESRIKKAIQVAEKYKPTVGGPIHIKCLK